jgi:hypothetical protein
MGTHPIFGSLCVTHFPRQSSLCDRDSRAGWLEGVAVLAPVILVALGGCAEMNELMRDLEGSPNQQATRPPAPAAANRPAEARVASVPVPIPPPPRPSAPSAAPSAPPAQTIKLVGLTQSATSDLLGPPTQESDANPGRIWEYRAPACTLQIHFFFNMGAREFQALHYETTGNPSSTNAADQCLAQVAEQAKRR